MGKGQTATIDWDERLAIGHPQIDAQHRQMVELFNALQRGVYAGLSRNAQDEMLDRLLALAADNFRAEEALMDALPADPRFEVHRAIHRSMLREMQMLREGLARRGAHLNTRTLGFISRWLFDHLTHSDRELVGAGGVTNSENRERPAAREKLP